MSKPFSELDIEVDEDELRYALRKAKGIIIGYAMEYRAMKILKQLGFQDIKLVTSPTHDIVATRNGQKYYIEVKASKYSPTKHYSAWKIAMIALLDGEHYTLIVRDNEYHLEKTINILSSPKQQLYKALVKIKKGEKPDETPEQYRDVIEWFKQQITIRNLQQKQYRKYQ